jgi:hypothetical protein
LAAVIHTTLGCLPSLWHEVGKYRLVVSRLSFAGRWFATSVQIDIWAEFMTGPGSRRSNWERAQNELIRHGLHKRAWFSHMVVTATTGDTTLIEVKLRPMMAPRVALVVVVEPSACLTVQPGISTEHRRSSSTPIWERSPREAAQHCVSALPVINQPAAANESQRN